MRKEYKMAKKFERLELKNVYLATWGYWEKYGGKHRNSKEFEEKLKPYVVEGYLKTDIKSLAEVAKILDIYAGEMLVINDDQTITFYDANY